MTYALDEIQLSVVKDLNTNILNSSFQKLIANDEYVIPVNDYFPNIWERKWFNDESIAGYKRGQCVWKNVIINDDFLDAFGDIVFQYAHESLDSKLNQYLLSSWSTVKAFDDDEKRLSHKEKPKFMNVISGFSQISSGIRIEKIGEETHVIQVEKLVQYYDKLFDYGMFETTDQLNASRVEIYVSTKDDNKDDLSCIDSWQSIVLSSHDAYQQYLSTEISIMFEKHLDQYHLGGLLTIEEYDDKLLAKNLSNFDINEIYNRNRLANHSSYVNQEGFDYVIKQHRETYEHNGCHLYRGFQLWSSGKLDHYGTIAVPKLDMNESSDPDDYIICVDLGWTYEENGVEISAETYNYPEASGTIDDSFAAFYFSTNSGIDVVKTIDASQKFIANDNSYSVNITPIQFDVKNDLSNAMIDDDPPQYRKVLKNFDYIKNHSYPSSHLSNKNKTYLSPDVHCLKNDSFVISKFDTDSLSSNDRAQYFSYYVSGYRKVIDYLNISVDIEPLGSGRVLADSFVVEKGSDIILSAFPTIDCQFLYWTGSKNSNDSPLSILNITNDIYLTAHFKYF